MTRQIIRLQDHPSNLDNTATLVSGPIYRGRDIYKVRGGYLACIGHNRAIEGLFDSLEDCVEAQILANNL